MVFVYTQQFIEFSSDSKESRKVKGSVLRLEVGRFLGCGCGTSVGAWRTWAWSGTAFGVPR